MTIAYIVPRRGVESNRWKFLGPRPVFHVATHVVLSGGAAAKAAFSFGPPVDEIMFIAR